MVDLEKHYGPADRVRLFRQAMHLTQDDFARMMEVAPSTVRNWEGGKSDPPGALMALVRLYEEKGVFPVGADGTAKAVMPDHPPTWDSFPTSRPEHERKAWEATVAAIKADGMALSMIRAMDQALRIQRLFQGLGSVYADMSATDVLLLMSMLAE